MSGIPGNLANEWVWNPSPNNGCRMSIRCRGHGSYILVTNVPVQEAKLTWHFRGNSGLGTRFQRSGRYGTSNRLLECIMLKQIRVGQRRISWSGTSTATELPTTLILSFELRFPGMFHRFSVSSIPCRWVQACLVDLGGCRRIYMRTSIEDLRSLSQPAKNK